MEIGATLYVKDRRQWRAWLARHHKTAPEIFRQRLRHFLKMTAPNKRFGMVQ
jgi:hypothetical protein